jgi:hypothetical protein
VVFLPKLVFVCALLVCSVAANAQSVGDIINVPLIVVEGFPLQVTLTRKLRFKENELVHARILEPVYAFDREVVPLGSEVLGRITQLEKPGKWTRLFSMLGGDFTPLREPRIVFDTLVLAGGVRIPIDTFVVPGAEKVVRFNEKKTEKNLKALASTVKKPGKEGLKNFLWSLAPYHPQSLPVGTRFKAILLAPLDFGVEVFTAAELEQIGAQPPEDSTVAARLITPLDSRTSPPGAPVEAVLTQPLFSSNHRLIFPVGSIVRGEVLEVKGARMWHRNGQLAFRFRTIESPLSLMGTLRVREIDGRLISVEVDRDKREVRIRDDGSAQIFESKTRFIAPGYALIKAGRSIDSGKDPFGRALVGAYRSKFAKRIGGNDPGLGLPASISSAMIPPVAIGLGFYGAARSVYSNFIGRGHDVTFSVNTLIEVRLD